MKAIIFDMDGLMVDNIGLYIESQKEAAKEYHVSISDDIIRKMVGLPSLDGIKLFINEYNVSVSPEDFLRKREEIYEIKLKKELQPMKGLYDIINEFSGKMEMAVATAAKKDHLDIIIDGLKLRNTFSVLLSKNDVSNNKPHPEIYLNTVEKLKLMAKDCIVLEDSEPGCLSADKAGCYVIAVPSEYTDKQDFSSAKFVAKDLIVAMKHIQKI